MSDVLALALLVAMLVYISGRPNDMPWWVRWVGLPAYVAINVAALLAGCVGRT